jgi:multimeric flavodoxin WrbA
MPNITVLVTFYSRGGSTETLAHAAAVGAVQARALIRLRRMPDADESGILDRTPECRETLRRMHKEYVAPREADVLAADAVIVASPADIDPASAEWTAFVSLLEQMHAARKLAGKVAAAVTTGPSSDEFAALLHRLGFDTIPDETTTPDAVEMDDVSRAIALGRKVAVSAQAAKAAP